MNIESPQPPTPTPTGPSIDDLPDALTVDEAAVVLRSDKKSVYRWKDRGIIKAVRLGRKVLIPKAEIVRILSQGGAAA